MNNRFFISLIIGVIISFWLLTLTFFIVDQRQFAIVFSFGEIKKVIKEPGLHFKLPFPFQNIIYLDKRILTIDIDDIDRFITSEKKNILIDTFVKWRIFDPRLYFISLGGDEERTQDRLIQIVKYALNEEITKRTVREIISEERGKVMNALQIKVKKEAKQIGLEIIDIRLKRIDYINKINNSVHDRMKSERMRITNKLRSIGFTEYEKIRTNADKECALILAKAYRDSEKIRGIGDAKASRIYANFFNKNPEFYRFYQSLKSYRLCFNKSSDIIFLNPNSEFFKYFEKI
ncbi:protease modulator HflC [Candidatus Profftella armatura (Diaphorina cf. continua)]|uniref:Protein HflC n=1 Tax=Candidatus Profftella armatura (Diaphorina cf. continua) TaxID=2661583 RepID=A0A7R6W0W7_9PROT|nr:protease modulator HflC [Candidatus Profftella armatura (Diaphorina cf. continua)]BCG49645.1 protease modulator HflC [Candidatus Profftella armatura (Diaphorina cf. continua)]